VDEGERLNKRLRKKKEKGEFSQKVFSVSFTPVQPDDTKGPMDWGFTWDAVIDFVEANDMVCGGSFLDLLFERCRCRVCSRVRAKLKKARFDNVTEEDRTLVQAWFLSHPEMFTDVNVGPIVLIEDWLKEPIVAPSRPEKPDDPPAVAEAKKRWKAKASSEVQWMKDHMIDEGEGLPSPPTSFDD
jgi:uncharacterized protein YggL (DUF469 family)